MDQSIGNTNTEMAQSIGNTNTEMDQSIGNTHTEMAQLIGETHLEMAYAVSWCKAQSVFMFAQARTEPVTFQFTSQGCYYLDNVSHR